MSTVPPPFPPPPAPPASGPPVAPAHPPYQTAPYQTPPYPTAPSHMVQSQPASPSSGWNAVTVLAAVLGVLIVAGVAWWTFRDAGVPEATPTTRPLAITETVPPSGPPPGQTEPLADGWLTYRTTDGTWLVDLPSVPASPKPLPSSPTVQIAYGRTDWGRVGFGWSNGQLSPGTDETAVLVELMKGIALSRGATDITPQVITGDAGVAVTATMELTGGHALFVLRSIDRRPVVAMVVAALGEPDATVAARMLDSFRPAG